MKADVEEKVATIRATLDELRTDDVLSGTIILEIDELLDRLSDATEATTSTVGKATPGR